MFNIEIDTFKLKDGTMVQYPNRLQLPKETIQDLIDHESNDVNVKRNDTFVFGKMDHFNKKEYISQFLNKECIQFVMSESVFMTAMSTFIDQKLNPYMEQFEKNRQSIIKLFESEQQSLDNIIKEQAEVIKNLTERIKKLEEPPKQV
jgi:hypothetical protein